MLDSTHFMNVTEKGNQKILMQGKSRSWSFVDMFIISSCSFSSAKYLKIKLFN